MDKMKLKILRARITATLKQLQAASERSKTENISVTTKNDFNSILDSIAEALPDVKASLPERIPLGPMLLERAGLAPLKFLDLQLKCSQLLEILDLIESEQ
jgi:hypothetical protein